MQKGMSMRIMKKFLLLFLNIFLLISLDSRVCFAMEAFAEDFGEDAANSLKAAARNLADEMGITEAEDIAKLEDTLALSMRNVPDSVLKDSFTLDTSLDAAKNALKDSLNTMKEAGENMGVALDKFGAGSDAMTSLTNAVRNDSEEAIKSSLKTAFAEGEISAEKAADILNSFEESKGAAKILEEQGSEEAGAGAAQEENAAAGTDAVVAEQNALKDDFEMLDAPEGQEGENVGNKGGSLKDKIKTKFQKFKNYFSSDIDLEESQKAADDAQAAAQEAQEAAEKPGASEETKKAAEDAQKKAQSAKKLFNAQKDLVDKQKLADDARAQANEASDTARDLEKKAINDPEFQEDAQAARKQADDLNAKANELDQDVVAAKKDVTDLETELKSSKGFFQGISRFVSEQIAMISFMTIPQMMQQAIEEELNRKAALRTVAQPVKFGHWVLQLVESCINEENPLQSVPLYVTVPVANIGDDISQQTSAAFHNSIVGGMQGYGDVKIMGIAGSDAVDRYKTGNFDYYKYAKFVMSYPSQSYNHIGDSLITDPSFSGLLVDLKDGYAIDATGEQIKTPPSPPLISMKANAPQYQSASVNSISSACDKILYDKLKTAGLAATYATYSGINSGSDAASIATFFDCEKKFTDKTSSHSCLISPALSAYAGSVSWSSSRAVVKGSSRTFGFMTPLFGWGTDFYSKILNEQNFPHLKAWTEKDAQAQGLVVTGKVESESDDTHTAASKTPVITHFAKADVNYAAEGCWVYICTQTPFVQNIRHHTLNQGPRGPFVDYVIFVDENGNQVPLQAPVETAVAGTDGNVYWPSIQLNPKAKFLISLITADMPEFQVNGAVTGWQNDGVTYANSPAFSTVVQSAISTLQTSFPELYAQFNVHRKALIELYRSGPFTYGNDVLQEATNYNLTDGNGNPILYVYTGSYCFATSGKDTVADLLIALTTTGSATGLPDKAVSNFVSLVTDIKYTLAADGSLVAKSQESFSAAPGTWNGTTFTPDISKKDTLAWLPYIYEAYTKPQAQGGPGLTISQSDYENLTHYVQTQRDAWFNNFSNSALEHGVTMGALHMKLAPELDAQDAQANQLYLYTVAPSPTATLVNKDWFIVVADQQPALSSLAMVDVASSPTTAKALVSLVTGMVYDMNGAPLMLTSAGSVTTTQGSESESTRRAIMLSTQSSGTVETIGQTVYDYLQQKYAGRKGLSSLFAQQFKTAVDYYAVQVNNPILVGSLGGISLGIYAGDLSFGNYTYFNTAGLSSASPFEPTDLFMTVRQKSDGSVIFGEQFIDASSGGDDTKFIVSLISGEVYDAHGPKFAMDITDISKYATAQSVYWRSYLKDILQKLQTKYTQQKAAEAQEQELLDKKQADVTYPDILWTPTQVQAMISRLANVAFLPAPYAMLKQDPLGTHAFVKLSPGSLTDATKYNYTFFNVPNSYKKQVLDSMGKPIMGADGKPATEPMQVGVMYTAQGEILQVIKGNILTAMMHQYGIYGDGTTLGVPMLQPSLLMDTADATLKAGSDGSSMIVSSSANFPGNDGAAVTSALASGYSLYYSRKMNSYYVLDKMRRQWIGLAGGHQYTLNGQPIPVQQSVAVNQKGKKKSFNLLLLEENQAGYMQGTMADLSHDNDITSWINVGTGSWKNQFGDVAVTPVNSIDSDGNSQATSYTMTFKTGVNTEQQITYTVDQQYDWLTLMYLPIDGNGHVITDTSKMPDDSLKSGRIVRYNGAMKYVLLGDEVYTVQSSDSKSYTLVSMSNPKDIKTLTMGVDVNTNVPYVMIADSTAIKGLQSAASLYGYLYNKLSDDALSSFLINTVAYNANATGAITVCPTSFAVGPMVTPKGADSSVKVPRSRTYTLYIPGMSDAGSMNAIQPNTIKGVPHFTSSTYQAFSQMLVSHPIYKSSNGRFFAQTYKKDNNPQHAPFFSYFNRNGYVDLQTAALFDAQGNAMGTSLKLDDWLLLLNKLSITVTVDQNGNADISYRGPVSIEEQEKQAGISGGKTTAPTEMNN